MDVQPTIFWLLIFVEQRLLDVCLPQNLPGGGGKGCPVTVNLTKVLVFSSSWILESFRFTCFKSQKERVGMFYNKKVGQAFCIFVGLRCDESDVRLFVKPKGNGPRSVVSETLQERQSRRQDGCH